MSTILAEAVQRLKRTSVRTLISVGQDGLTVSIEAVQRLRRTSVPRGRYLPLVAALLGVVLLSGLFFLFRAKLTTAVAGFGYLGVFIASFAGAATLLLPLPQYAAVFFSLTFLNPFLVPLVAAAGEALGELTGYLIGYGGRAVVQSRNIPGFRRLEGWMKRWGAPVLFLWSAIPNPFYDVAGIAAGGLRFPLWQFLPVVWAGKVLKWAGVTFLFTSGLRWVVEYFQTLP